MSSVREEAGRLVEYTEATIETIGKKIKEIVAEGLAYDIEVRKNGRRVYQMPVAVAGVLAAASLLPPTRLLAAAGFTAAGLAGYTFRLHKKPVSVKKKSR